MPSLMRADNAKKTKERILIVLPIPLMTKFHRVETISGQKTVASHLFSVMYARRDLKIVSLCFV